MLALEEDIIADIAGEGVDEAEGKILYSAEEPYFKQKKRLKLTTNRIKIVFPRKRKLRSAEEFHVNLKWKDISSYEVLEVLFDSGKNSCPINEQPPKGFKSEGKSGEFFVFGFIEEETWFAMNVFFPLKDISIVKRMMKKYTGRPPIPGLAHYGNLAIVKYIIDHCNILGKYEISIDDFVYSSRLVKQSGLMEMSLKLKKDEQSPFFYVCSEGLGILFTKDNKIGFQQSSTFWPWSKIEEVFEHKGAIVGFKWKDEPYRFGQLVSDEDLRNDILEKCNKALSEYNPKLHTWDVFIRPNSFPSRYTDTWFVLEPMGCKASRDGFPPKDQDAR
ncbi:MAG: hypothetical protein ACFE7E_00485 [Candidatus Hodarchaeota archaeon]